MDDRSPVLGIKMGYVQLCLLISCTGIAIVLAYGLWRLVTGHMSREELEPYSGSVGE